MRERDNLKKWTSLLKGERKVHLERAPVGEVICDLQFEDLGWGLLEYGRYYERIRKRYPECATKPPLAAVSEAPQGRELQFDLSSVPLPRLWFSERGGPYLIQLQKDRFILNWRKLSDEEAYPHFLDSNGSEGVWGRFVTEFALLREFQDETGREPPRPTRCELAYINHLSRGRDWESPSDVGRLLKPFASCSAFRFRERLALGPEVVNLHMVFSLPGERGHLALRSYPGKRVCDDQEMFFVELRASGPISAGASDKEIAAWFATAHSCIVLGFVDLATEEGKLHWGYSSGQSAE